MGVTIDGIDAQGKYCVILYHDVDFFSAHQYEQNVIVGRMVIVPDRIGSVTTSGIMCNR